MDNGCSGNSALLMSAIRRKDHADIERLLRGGADPNFFNVRAPNGNCTPLLVATAVADPVAVRILLRWGAKAATKNTDQLSPLDLACLLEHSKIEALLVERFTEEDLPETSPQWLYVRRPGTSSMTGQMYEYKLLGLVLLRLKQGRYQFHLGSNVDGIGEFDDLCVRYRRNGQTGYKYVFVQAKHREDPVKKRITYDLLKKVNCKTNSDYSAHKHFENYLKIREKFSNTSEEEFFSGSFEDLDIEFVLFTTANSDYAKNSQSNMDALLKTSEDGRVVLIEPNDEIIQSLCTHVNNTVVEQIQKNEKKLKEPVFTKKLVVDFLRKFRIYYSQATENEVGQIIGKELESSVENRRLLNLMYHDLVQKYWMGKGESGYLTESCKFLEEAMQLTADRCLLSRLTSIFYSKATSLKLDFCITAITGLNLDLLLFDRSKIYVNIYSKVPQLSFAKISQYLMGRFGQQLAIIDFDQIDEYVEIFSDFSNSNSFDCLIIYCTVNRYKLQDYFSTRVAQFRKKIIFLSDEPFHWLQGCENRSDTAISFVDLMPECQERIMNSKSIIFQNAYVRLFEIFGTVQDVDRVPGSYLTGEILLKLLKGDNVRIARLRKEPIDYFVRRKLCPHTELSNIQIHKKVTIATIESFQDRVVVLAAEPGMGKSTLLTELLATQRDASVWIVRCNLLDFTQRLRELNDRTIDLGVTVRFILHALGLPESCVEIRGEKVRFNPRENHDCVTILELMVFERYFNQGKVVVFADGFDEIAPMYMRSVLDVLNVLKTSNIRKLFVTTRNTSVLNKLESHLGVLAYSLVPFTLLDIREFCIKYWNTNSKLAVSNGKRVQRFTSVLVHNYRKTIVEDVFEFISVPLHTEMIARCVQEKFEKFYTTRDESYLDQIRIVLKGISLYNDFIHSKFVDIYLKDKNKIDPTLPICDDFDFEKLFYDRHRRLALVALFDHDMAEFLSPGTLAEVPNDLKIVAMSKEKSGFVCRVVDGKPQFVHLTFAEYFVAGVIWESFKRCSERQFSKFVDQVLFKLLIESDKQQLIRFLQDLAMLDTTNDVTDFVAKGCLLLEKMSFKSKSEPTAFFISLLERCIFTDHSEILEFVVSVLSVKERWALFVLAIGQGCFNLLRALNGTIGQALMKKVVKHNFSLLHNINEDKKGLECAKILVNEFGYDVNWLDCSSRTTLGRMYKVSKFVLVTALLDSGLTELAISDNSMELPAYKLLASNDMPQEKIGAFVKAINVVQFEPNFLPRISINLLNEPQSLTEEFLKKGVDVLQTFLLSETDILKYEEYLLTPRWINQMQLFIGRGVGFHTKLLQSVKHINAMLAKRGESLKEVVDNSSRLIPVLENLNSAYFKLVDAIKTGQKAKVKRELTSIQDEMHRKAIINGRDEVIGSPLLYAASVNSEEIAEILLDHGANPNIILYCETNPHHFSKVNGIKNITPLHVASCLGYPDFVKLLLVKGAKIHYRTPDTPLHLAAREGHIEVVRILLLFGARVDALKYTSKYHQNGSCYSEEEEGHTARDLAARRGHTDVVKLLESHQRTVAIGCTELHKAAAYNDMDRARILLQTCKIPINATIKFNGYTPLHVGADNGHAAIVLLLLNNKADKHVKSATGKTPQEVALEGGFYKVANIIEHFQRSHDQLQQSYIPDFIRISQEEEKCLQNYNSNDFRT